MSDTTSKYLQRYCDADADEAVRWIEWFSERNIRLHIEHPRKNAFSRSWNGQLVREFIKSYDKAKKQGKTLRLVTTRTGPTWMAV